MLARPASIWFSPVACQKMIKQQQQPPKAQYGRKKRLWGLVDSNHPDDETGRSGINASFG
jgi:hypothetical protein